MKYKSETELLQHKVLDRVNNSQPQIAEVITQIKEENRLLTDSLAFTDGFKFRHDNEGLTLTFDQSEMRLGRFATKQIATKFGIPAPYLSKLSTMEWGGPLSANILNRHASNLESRRLLIRTTDDTVRGVLSDSYKRINSMQIFLAFLQGASTQDAMIYNATIDDTKSFIEVIIPEIVEIDSQQNGKIHLIMGAELRNSDYGDGRLNLRTFMMNAACLNGMLGQKYLNEVHRGGRLPENLVLSQDTYEKESAAQAGVVTDSMAHLFSKDQMQQEIDKIQRATETPMDIDKGVQRLKKTKHFSTAELDMLVNKLTAERPEDGIQGEPTRWKFVQGITAVANEYKSTRRNELIELGSEILN